MIVRFTKKAQKYYDNMPKSYQDKIMDGIKGLTKNPPEGDIKNLSGYDDGTKRLRVGKYRVIYKYLNDNIVEVLLILDIGSRGDIYK